MPVSKKTVLITGCSDGGIGAAMVKVFHEKGYHVFATLRNTSKAGTLTKLNDVEILELEVASEESIAKCVEQVRSRTGGTLDILVNNAGRDFVMPLLDADIDEAKKLFDVNFWSMLVITQAFSPMLIKAKGVIVNHGSIVWNLFIPWGGIYSASKAAIKQLSDTMRVELQPLGVRVVTVVIGAVDTPVFINSNPEPFKMPSSSYYQPIRQLIEDQRDGKVQPKMEHVDVTARHIVNDVLGGASGCIWYGEKSTDAKWLSWLLPAWALEMITNGTKGLSELRQYYATGS
ncbi:putative short-chain dehydrogenase/reductase [Hypoxylon crocopeplum]|nr:putative short-chain dehydrogenase/reductase [Hypoxylon crocopeplum]